MAQEWKPSADEKIEYVEHIEMTDKPESFPDHLHAYMRSGLSIQDSQFLHEIPGEKQDKIFNKVDWRLCPMLAVLYLISHLDRSVAVDRKSVV